MGDNPVIKVKEGGKDFTMIDCDVVAVNRPALVTEAENTQLIRTRLASIKTGNTESPKRNWFSMDNPVIYIIVVLILAFIAFMASWFGWPLHF